MKSLWLITIKRSEPERKNLENIIVINIETEKESVNGI